MTEFAIERFDAIARDVCRCFAEGNRVQVMAELSKVENQMEVALVVAMTCGWMTEGTRKSFIDFLTLQAMSLQGSVKRQT